MRGLNSAVGVRSVAHRKEVGAESGTRYDCASLNWVVGFFVGPLRPDQFQWSECRAMGGCALRRSRETGAVPEGS